MALSKIQADSMNLADTYAFSGTVSGTGYTKLLDQSISTSDGTFVVNNTYINSTYDRYHIFYEVHTCTENDVQMQVKFYI